MSWWQPIISKSGRNIYIVTLAYKALPKIALSSKVVGYSSLRFVLFIGGGVIRLMIATTGLGALLSTGAAGGCLEVPVTRVLNNGRDSSSVVGTWSSVVCAA